jgi:type I restriction enzyme M protein
VRTRIREVIKRREELARPDERPDDPVIVLTVAQTGELRPREEGKGNNPPECRGMYFENISTKWIVCHAGDVVFSRIYLWKGCISAVSTELDGALVSGEFPVYEIQDKHLDPDFLSTLLQSRYYKRAFRAITIEHSNRRRTQIEDFEDLEICFPAERSEQRKLVADVMAARRDLHNADDALKLAMLAFTDAIDHRDDKDYDLLVQYPHAE